MFKADIARNTVMPDEKREVVRQKFVANVQVVNVVCSAMYLERGKSVQVHLERWNAVCSGI